MNDVERLIEIEEIKKLKARYFLFVDTKQWDEWEKLFSEDIVMDVTEDFPGGDNTVLKGRSGLIPMIRDWLGETKTIHHGHMPIIELTGPETATGVWAFEDQLHHPKGGHIHGYGHYHERYAKVDGKWVFEHIRITRLRLTRTKPPKP